MPQTFYVTQDEEILSLVGRLRSSALLENVFVVPKRALILQSVVNLRILAREAEKLGKAVVIVTQDNDGRLLAEKAGIATRAYSEETRMPDQSSSVMPQEHVSSRQESAPVHRVTIGSDDFFGSGGSNSSSEVAPAPIRSDVPKSVSEGEMKLRIRDNSPKNLTSLNSSEQRQAAQQSTKNQGEILRRQALEQRTPDTAHRQEMPVRISSNNTKSENPGRLSQIFRSREDNRRAYVAKAPESRTSDNVGKVGSKVGFWFFLFISISTLSLVGTGAFLFLPKAEIVVIPNASSQSVEIEFEGRTEGVTEEKQIPIRVIEKEMEVTVSAETSGNSSGNGEKARGKITISNEFDTESQPLVATTRFESSDGKIFRLARGVTVPGMSENDGEKKAGIIEAEVVADESGEAYNIEPSSFTIPGFKGSPKYGKFSAKSTSKMSGGSTGEESKNRAVSSADINRAKEEAQRKFRSSFEEAIRSEISDEERFLPQSAEVSLIGAPSHPQIGVAASSFEYASKWIGKIFVFSEKDLREKAGKSFMERSDGSDTAVARDISFEYGDATTDYGKGSVYVRTRVTATFVSEINTESLKDEFLGKGADEIREALGKHPEIRKIEINLKPKFFTFSVPKDKKRVMVRIEEP